ncbi:hypothetical protein SRB5_68970 [Streptomyces sp. RB5]|uniref:Band 7 domain-containing protein n=1 Tax=Streptomyces smaragdinus TaxID=2585196 RepID=A0A7K0CT89_9ACTN|nr:prohibitin family protein [Streptomyces smaragdinus]MQY16695.1 hypothetical protein [Streptomyces smaragdinus]
MFYFAVFLLIAAVVLFTLGVTGVRGGLRGWAIGTLVAGALFVAGSCVHVVGASEVGVPVTLGKTGGSLQSGVHFVSPVTSVTTYSTRPVDLDFSGEDVVEVRSSEGGAMNADLTVKWSVTPGRAVHLYELAGDEDSIEERLVQPDSREIVRNVFARHTAVEGYSTARPQIAVEITEEVRERLAPRGITVTTVNLRNVEPSKELQARIDRMMEQEQATVLAEEAAKTAEAQAAKAKIDAEAAAERRQIEAESVARANRLLNGSLTDKVLYAECIKAFKEAAAKGAVYAVPCGSGSRTPVIVDGGR